MTIAEERAAMAADEIRLRIRARLPGEEAMP